MALVLSVPLSAAGQESAGPPSAAPRAVNDNPRAVRASSPSLTAGRSALTAAPLATRRDRGESSGPALSLGLGHLSAGIGLQLSYELRLGHRPWALAPFVSGGLSSVTACCNDLAYTAGAKLLWGWGTRLGLALAYGAVTNHDVAGKGNSSVYGVIAALGVERVAPFGVLIRLYGGVAVPTDGTPHEQGKVIPAIDLSFGWKM